MRSEATLRALLDNTPSMMGVVELAPGDDDVLHLLDNACAERFFGVEPGGTAGKWARRDLGAAADTVRRWADAYREARRTGRPVRFAYDFDAPSASNRWMDVSVSYMGPGGDGRDRFCYTAIDDTERRRAEDALRRAEERFRASQEASLFGFVILRAVRDDGGRIVDFEWEYVNPAALALRRRPAEHFLGRRMTEVVADGRQIRALIDRYARVVETGEPDDYEMPYESGELRGWFRNTAVRLGDGVAVSIADITTRKHAEQRLALLADAGKVLAVVHDVPDIMRQVVQLSLPSFADWCLVDFVDEGGAIERIAAAHADPTREPLVRALQRHAPTTWDADSSMARVLKTGLPVLVSRAHEACVARDDEHARVLAELSPRSAIVAPLAARGRTFGAIAWVRSRTLDYEDADVDVAHELARRAAAAVDNARLFQQIAASDRRKDEFLATMAHELRNPLAPIRNAVAVLQAKGPQDPELVWSREVIARQVGQMARLLDDLLDVSRITRNKLELRRQRVVLADVIDSAVETSRPLLDAHGHTLTVDLPREPVALDGDPVRLAQVFANLLNNAAKYTDRGGRVRLSAARRGDVVAVTVADTGIGLAREMLPRLFEMFSQAAPAIDRAQGGLGIGLALVKGIVQMHGGAVEAHSDGPGRGSTFVVTLPVAAAVAEPAPEPPAPRPARAGARRIVVADDNHDAAESLALWLDVHGHDVRVAHDGREALAVTAEFRPDVALLDIGMPGLNGYEVARAIREQPWGAALVLVALTGWGQEEDKRRARAAGFDRHLTKPVDPPELERALAELVAAPRP